MNEHRNIIIKIIVITLIGLGVLYVLLTILTSFVSAMLGLADTNFLLTPLFCATVLFAIYSVIVNILILKGVIRRKFPFSVCGNIIKLIQEKLRNTFGIK